VSTNLEKISTQRSLLASLIIVASVIIIANFVSEDITILAGNLIYVPVVGGLVVLSIFISIKSGTIGKHGKAWIFFTLFVVSWFIAEIWWTINELVLEIDPFPSEADIFYIAGYPFLFFFAIYYLRPMKDAISKKILSVAIGISMIVLASTLYITFETETDLELFEIIILASYPIGDGILLVPAIIGVVLFFKGKVNFLWSLILIGIITVTIADTLFLVTQVEDSYYTGHPLEILFYWAYLFFAFGVYDHLKIFRKL